MTIPGKNELGAMINQCYTEDINLSVNTRLISLPLLVLLIISLYTPVHAQGVLGKQEVSSITVHMLAVNDENQGSVIDVEIEAYTPGTGKVDVIDPGGKIAPDTYTSIKYSLVLASILTGKDYRIYDYTIRFPPGTIIEGTSATLELTIGFTALLLGEENPPQDRAATGLVFPNSIIGNVSGVKYKYDAAIDKGINYVYGPPQPVQPGDKYVPVTNVFTATEKFLDTKILPTTIIKIVSPTIMTNAFLKSYKEFEENITRIIKIAEKYGIDLKDTNGYKELELAQKYAEKYNDTYTAASYAFRAFIDLYTDFIEILLSKSSDPRYSAIYSEAINNIIKWIKGNITLVEKLLNTTAGTVENYPNIWNIDTYVNAYVRYSSAIMFNNIASSTPNKAIAFRYYILALARIHSARHWLRLLSKSSIEKNIDLGRNPIFDEYVKLSIDYFGSMKYTNQTHYARLFKEASETTGVTRLAKYMDIVYSMTFLLLSEPEITGIFITPEAIQELETTLKRIASVFNNKTGEIPPSIVSTIQVLNDYEKEGEDTATLGSLLYLTLSIVVPELVLVNINPLTNTTGANPPIISMHTSIVPANIIIVTTFILVGIGSFLLGIYVGKDFFNPTRRESQESSYTYVSPPPPPPPEILYHKEASKPPENPSPRGGGAWENKEQLQDDM